MSEFRYKQRKEYRSIDVIVENEEGIEEHHEVKFSYTPGDLRVVEVCNKIAKKFPAYSYEDIEKQEVVDEVFETAKAFFDIVAPGRFDEIFGLVDHSLFGLVGIMNEMFNAINKKNGEGV